MTPQEWLDFARFAREYDHSALDGDPQAQQYAVMVTMGIAAVAASYALHMTKKERTFTDV